MKKYFKEYSEHLPAIILLFYLFGFTYQYMFYSYFNIYIQYYITLTDVVFSAIKNLTLTLVFIGLIELVLDTITAILLPLIYKLITKQKRRNLPRHIKNRYQNHLNYLIERRSVKFKFYLCVILFIALFWSSDRLFVFSLIFPAFIYRLMVMLRNQKNMIATDWIKPLYILLFLMLLNFYGFWGHRDASEAKIGFSSKVVNIDNISTGDGNHKYIGETTNYIFIYNSKSKKVKALNKASINLIEFEDNKFRSTEFKNSKKDLQYYINLYKIPFN